MVSVNLGQGLSKARLTDSICHSGVKAVSAPGPALGALLVSMWDFSHPLRNQGLLFLLLQEQLSRSQFKQQVFSGDPRCINKTPVKTLLFSCSLLIVLGPSSSSG